MGDFEECPSCAKPVVGRPALLAHLEFSHQIVDPGAHLEAIEHPSEPGRSVTPLLIWSGAGLAVLAVMVVGALVVSGGSDDATGEAVAVEPLSMPGATESDTATIPQDTSAPTTAPRTTAPPTTVPSPTTGPPRAVSGGAAVAVDDFRLPFLRDARVVSCVSADGSDVYLVEFTLSGARDIVLGGVPYPGRTGDGDHRIEHATASGAPSWLGHVDVGDGGGTLHRVEIFPALYLVGC